MFKFPYTNFHEMNLTWVIETVKKLVDEWVKMQGDFSNLQGDFEELKKYVTDYFAKLEIDKEVRKILEEMKTSGELSEIIFKYCFSCSIHLSAFLRTTPSLKITISSVTSRKPSFSSCTSVSKLLSCHAGLQKLC